MIEILTAEVLPLLIRLIGFILAILFTWGAKKLIDLVGIKIIEEVLFIAKVEVREIVMSVFAQLEEDVKDKAKEDGLDREDVEYIKTNAIAKLKKELPNVVKSILEKVIDDIDELFGDWIEEYLELGDFLPE